MVEARTRKSGPAEQGIKRAMDIGLALAGLIALAPVMAAIAFAIRLTMGGPVLFRQLRAGYHGRSFEFIKFRTMREEHGPDSGWPPDEERITPLGRVLRRTSLDELPELWNVVKGEMSLVGPRPLLVKYLARYSPEQARRHDVRPGVTGLAQVKGRDLLRWDDRFRLDIWYVENWSLRLDLRILRTTVAVVMLGGGLPPGTEPDYRFPFDDSAGEGDANSS
jgi:lipopolysaccharide/colanic/teichoic acid biosynthesis glycosyltransferase